MAASALRLLECFFVEEVALDLDTVHGQEPRAHTARSARRRRGARRSVLREPRARTARRDRLSEHARGARRRRHRCGRRAASRRNDVDESSSRATFASTRLLGFVLLHSHLRPSEPRAGPGGRDSPSRRPRTPPGSADGRSSPTRGRAASGTSPRGRSRGTLRRGSGSGIARRSAFVYGCFGSS